MFTGPVEVDETYIGGKRKNIAQVQACEAQGTRHRWKDCYGGREGSGDQSCDGAVVPATDAKTLQGFVADNAAPGAKVYTDEASAYRGMPFDHESVNHGVGEYVRDMASTQGIDSFWSMLKRGYQGTFHHFSEKHTDRYVTEFAGRHNDRDADTLDQMAAIVRGMVGKRVKFADLTA